MTPSVASMCIPSSLPFPLTYYVPDLGITIYNAAYAKQTHSKNAFPRLCITAYTLKTWKLYYTNTKAKGANLQNNVFAQFPGSPLPVKKPL